MATKRFRELLRKVKPGARERSKKDAPEPIAAAAAEPEVPVARSLPEYLAASAELREAGRFDEADALLTEALEQFPDDRRLRFDWALLPHFRLDWAEAVRRSEIVRAEFPDAPAAHALGAIVLRELGRYDDAENLLSAAREHFPDDLRIASESAWLATHRQNWAEALRRWGLVRKRFPDWPGGYTGTAMIYRELTWFDEAEVTLEDAVERFPAEPDLCIEYARLAEAMGDRREAARRWEIVRARFPDQPAGYEEGAAALRELGRQDEVEALLVDAAKRFTAQAATASEHAGTPPVDGGSLADAGAAPPHALEPDIAVAPPHAAEPDIAAEPAPALEPDAAAEPAHAAEESPLLVAEPIPAETLQRDSDHATTAERGLTEYLSTARQLRESRRLEEAHAVLTEAIERFPDDPDLLSEAARVAEWRGDWAAAARQWEAVHVRRPEHALAHVGHARALVNGGQDAQAEALLEDAVQRFPDNFEILMTRADCATRRRDWPEADHRWEALRQLFPDSPWGYFGGGRSLLDAGRLDAADVLLVEARARFPRDAGSAAAWTECAAKRGDWQQTLVRWDRVHNDLPDSIASYSGAAAALQKLGRSEEAELLLLAAQERFPENEAPFIEHAWLVHADRDWAKEAALWERVRERFASHVTAYVRGAVALREMGRVAEAEELLRVAVERFPDDAWAFIEYALLAQIRRDWPEASQRWSEVRARFPTNAWGYSGGARTLAEMGDIAAAETLLAEAIERFPVDPKVMLGWAESAVRRRDWPQAAERWESVRARFPDQSAGYVQGANALRELGRLDDAEALISEAMQRFPDEERPAIEFAFLAHHRRDWTEALERWQTLRGRFRACIEGHLHGAIPLNALRRHDEAERLVAEAISRFPDSAELASEYAWIAAHRHRWAEAEERFETVRNRFPDSRTGYWGGAAVLRMQGRFPEAQAILEAAMSRLPDDAELVLEYARLPMAPGRSDQKDWGEAFRRLEHVRSSFPAFENGWAVSVRSYREAERFDAAEELAADALARFPTSVDLALQRAEIAIDRAEWQEATERFAAIAQRFPHHRGGFIGVGDALGCAGRHEEADAILRDAIDRFPSSPEILSAYANAANRRLDWREAFARWSNAQQRFPDDRDIAQQVFAARMRLAETEGEIDDAANAPTARAGDAHPEVANSSAAARESANAEIARVDGKTSISDERSSQPVGGSGLAASELVMNFESLGGGGHGCEFGILQRECGAEPLGLLRWADLAPHLLAEALESEFDGVGLSEHTEVFVPPDSDPAEYWTRDRRYWMAMRTFVQVEELSLKQMRDRACRRLRFLRRKLMDDLRNGDKIFVYKVLERNLADAELKRIHNAMRQYGDNTLLYVRYEDENHPNGTVELAARGLLIGYIDRFSNSPAHEYLGLASESWLAICRKAHALWQQSQERFDLASADHTLVTG